MNNIERERPEHAVSIHALLVASFPTHAEAGLVDDLRAADALPVSLVASEGGSILGHISFSPGFIRPAGLASVVWTLAPLAISPAAQRRGPGSALVRAGLRACADAGCDAVVVLGDPDFYRRFGFLPAAEHGLRCSFEAPPEAFMLTELHPASLPFHDGTVYFHSAFDRFATPNELSRNA